MTAFLLKTKLIAPVRAIQENPRGRERRRVIRALEMFDRSLTKKMLETAQQVKQKPTWKWSPELMNMGKIFNYWKAKDISDRRGKPLHPRAEQNLIKIQKNWMSCKETQTGKQGVNLTWRGRI